MKYLDFFLSFQQNVFMSKTKQIVLFILALGLLVILYPFTVKMEIKINIIKLKGVVTIQIFKKIKFQFKFRVKNGYVYIYYKKKEKKEQISNKNFSFVFIINLMKHLYFREEFVDLGFISNFGYSLESRITALVSSYIDVISKCVLAKIKNNKKSSHIFTQVEPKYNQDIFNSKIINEIKISIFDLFYSFILAMFYAWREYLKHKTPIFKS